MESPVHQLNGTGDNIPGHVMRLYDLLSDYFLIYDLLDK